MATKSITRILPALGVLATLCLSPVRSLAFQPHQPQQAGQQTPQAQQPPQQLQPAEAHLAREVRHQLVLLPYYSIFDWFEFSVEGYTVTLSGEVVQPVLKSDAENVVKHIEGVQKVINNLKVLPLSGLDNQIRRAEFRAIYGNPALSDRYGFQAMPPIHIIVENGHVTLKGVVANTFDKNVAGVQANGVPNVFSVDNQLQVEQQAKGK
jgi:hyperosmotically inducible periplasmic protein